MRDKPKERKIAGERIAILMRLAGDEAVKGNAKRTRRYVALAKRIGTRYNVRFPAHLKRKLCRHCDSYLLPSVTCRVRLTGGKVSIFCNACGKFTRIPYTRERRARMGRARRSIP